MISEQEMAVFGGFDGKACLNDLQVFHLGRRIWSTVQACVTSPHPRMGHSAALIGGQLLLFGGSNGDILYSDVHIYNAHLRSWSLLHVRGEVPAAREGHSLVGSGDELWMLGGFV
jgi:N-acetylneuraminic acid mutarotase